MQHLAISRCNAPAIVNGKMWRSTFTELVLGTFLTVVLTGILAEQNRNMRLPPSPYYAQSANVLQANVPDTCTYSYWPSCGGSCPDGGVCTSSFSCNPSNPSECTALCVCSGGITTSPSSPPMGGICCGAMPGECLGATTQDACGGTFYPGSTHCDVCGFYNPCPEEGCDDGDACTEDMCTSGGCTHSDIPDCCTEASECASGDPCWMTDCISNRCFGMYMCCDDGNPCTTDYPNSGTDCYHDPIPGCTQCSSDTVDEDCPQFPGMCLHYACIDGVCQTPFPCCDDDGDPCTTERLEGTTCYHDPVPGCGSSASSSLSFQGFASSEASSAPTQLDCMEQNHVGACPSGGACLPAGSQPCSQVVSCCDTSGSLTNPSFSCCATAPCDSLSDTCMHPSAQSSSAAPQSSAPITPSSSSVPAASSAPASSSASSEDLVSCCFDDFCSDDVPAGLCDDYGSPAEDPFFGGGNGICDSNPCGGGTSSAPAESSSAQSEQSSLPQPSSSAHSSSSHSQPPSSSSRPASSSSSHSQPRSSAPAESSSSIAPASSAPAESSSSSYAPVSSAPEESSSSSTPAPASSSEPTDSSSSSSSGCAEADKRSCCYDDEEGKHHCENGICPDECRRRGSSPYPVDGACPPDPPLFSSWWKWLTAWLLGASGGGNEVKSCPVPYVACCRQNCSISFVDSDNNTQNIPGTYKFCSDDNTKEACEGSLSAFLPGTAYALTCGGGALQEKQSCRADCKTTAQILCCFEDENPPKTSWMFRGSCEQKGGREVSTASECKPILKDCCVDRMQGKVEKKTTKQCSSPAFLVTGENKCEVEKDCDKLKKPSGGMFAGCTWKESAGQCSSNTTAETAENNPGVCCCPQKQDCCRQVSRGDQSDWTCTYEVSTVCEMDNRIGDTYYHRGAILNNCSTAEGGNCTAKKMEPGCCCNLKTGPFAGTASMWISYPLWGGYEQQSPQALCEQNYKGAFTKSSGMGGKSCDAAFCSKDEKIACCPPKPASDTAPWKCAVVLKSEKTQKCDPNPPKEFSGSMCPTDESAYCRDPERKVPCCYKTEDTDERMWDCALVAQSVCDTYIRHKQLAGDACPAIGKERDDRCGNASQERVHCCTPEGSTFTCSLKKVSECTSPSVAVSGKTTEETCTEEEMKKCKKEEPTVACCPLEDDGSGQWNCIDVPKSQEAAKCQKGTTFGELKCSAVTPKPVCYKPPEKLVACCSVEEGTCWQMYLQEGKSCDTKNGLFTYYPTVYDPPSSCNSQVCKAGNKAACCSRDSEMDPDWSCAQAAKGTCTGPLKKELSTETCPADLEQACGPITVPAYCCPAKPASGAWSCTKMEDASQCQGSKRFGSSCPTDPAQASCEELKYPCCENLYGISWSCSEKLSKDCGGKVIDGAKCPAESQVQEVCGKDDPKVACCMTKDAYTDSCSLLTEKTCSTKGGTAKGSTCSPDPCVKKYACCTRPEGGKWSCDVSEKCDNGTNTKNLGEASACPANWQEQCPDKTVACCKRASPKHQWNCAAVLESKCTEDENTKNLGQASSCPANWKDTCVDVHVPCCYWVQGDGGPGTTKWNCVDDMTEDWCNRVGGGHQVNACPSDTSQHAIERVCGEMEKPVACCPKTGGYCQTGVFKENCDENKPISDANSCADIKCTEEEVWCCYQAQGATANSCNKMQETDLVNGECPWKQYGAPYDTKYKTEQDCTDPCVPKDQVACCAKNPSATGPFCTVVQKSEAADKCSSTFEGKTACTAEMESQCKPPQKKACCTYPAPSDGGGSLEATECSAVETVEECTAKSGTLKGDASTNPCSPNPCEPKIVPCCQKGSNGSWTCSNVNEESCKDPNRKVSACPANPADCGQIACCQMDGHGKLSGACGLAPSCSTSKDYMPTNPDGSAILSCTPNPCVEAQTIGACCVYGDELQVSKNKCITSTSDKCPKEDFIEKGSCSPMNPCEYIACCPKAGGACAESMQAKDCIAGKTGASCTEELQKLCTTDVPCCITDGEGKATGECKAVPEDQCSKKVSTCDPNTCKEEEKDTCCDPGKAKGETGECTPSIGFTDGQCPTGTVAMTQEACQRDGCAKPKVACCKYHSGTPALFDGRPYYACEETGTTAQSTARFPLTADVTDGTSSEGDKEFCAPGGMSDCTKQCPVGPIDGHGAGGSDGSSGDEASQPSSAGDGQSSSEDQPETGNCCIAGADFGMCFSEVEQATCESYAGSFYGSEQCIAHPETGYNCGPDSGSSSAGSVSSAPVDSSSSAASSESSATSCGNGTKDEGEECDDGNGNSDSPNALCRKDCKNARCGDGIKDSAPPDGRTAEACDDGDDCSEGKRCNGDTGTATCKKNCKNRNTFFTIAQWLQSLQLYAVNGTPIEGAPPVNENTEFIIMGALTFILQ